MTKVSVKCRPKSYEQKLADRRRRLAQLDNPISVVLPGEDEGQPVEKVIQKEENPLDFDKEPSPLPEVQLRPVKPKEKKKRIKKVDVGQYEVTVGEEKFKLVTSKSKPRPKVNKGFRDQLLDASTRKGTRSFTVNKERAHVDKWVNRKV